jgi:toxin ParE1/3/4
MSVRKRNRALGDLDEIAEYLQLRASPQTAIRFLENAEATFRRLLASPEIGARYDPAHPRLSDLRFLSIIRFRKYLAFYRPRPDGIEVVRVLHGARDIASLLDAEGDEADDPE